MHNSSANYALTIALLIGFSSALLGASPAHAEETQSRTVGIGYKVGNGIGFTGGDLIVRAVPRVVLDLQASYGAVDGLTGFGVAPTVQFQWKPVGHTPYVGVGVAHARLSNDSVGGYVTGFVANAGYEWRFASGLGVLAGGGVQDHGPVHVTRGSAVNESKWSGPSFNLEAGLRYFF
ncbi:MAG TPA: hypothetical protein VHF22_01050 [Planctomycetota bacterium]|nr:hypothetical protein [Planctomycetota bacterium]